MSIIGVLCHFDFILILLRYMNRYLAPNNKCGEIQSNYNYKNYEIILRNFCVSILFPCDKTLNTILFQFNVWIVRRPNFYWQAVYFCSTYFILENWMLCPP